MKRILLACTLLIYASISCAQNVDSALKAVLSIPDCDSQRLEKLYMVCWESLSINADKCFPYLEFGLKESRVRKESRQIYRFLVTLGTYYQMKAEFKKSEQYFKEAIEFSKTQQKQKWLHTCYNNLANTQYLAGDLKAAIQNYQAAIDIIKKYDKEARWGNSYQNIGAIFTKMEDYEAAIKNFSEGLKDINFNAVDSLNVLCNLANVYGILERKDSSTFFLKKASAVFTKLPQASTADRLAYYSMLSEYQIRFDGDRAVKAPFVTALQCAEELNSETSYIGALRLLGRYFSNQKMYDSATFYLKKALPIAIKISDLSTIRDVYMVLGTNAKATGQFEQATIYREKELDILDSIYKIQNTEAIRNAEISYDTKQKEKQNILLEKQKNNEKKLKNLYLLLGLLFTISLGAFAYNILRSKKKTELLYQQIAEKSEALEKSNAFKNRLLSIISHDVRAPIVGLQSLLSLINERHISAEKQAELNEKISIALHKTSYALDNLLYWSLNQNNNDGHLHLNSLNLSDIIQEQIDLLSPLAMAKSIIIQFDRTKQISVYADKDGLALVIRNLLNNAIKFSFEHSNININIASHLASKTILQIIDNGIGMDDETHEIKPGTNNEKGSGLGLQLVNEYCKRMQISYHIQSQKNKGCTASLEIPNAN